MRLSFNVFDVLAAITFQFATVYYNCNYAAGPCQSTLPWDPPSEFWLVSKSTSKTQPRMAGWGLQAHPPAEQRCQWEQRKGRSEQGLQAPMGKQEARSERRPSSLLSHTYSPTCWELQCTSTEGSVLLGTGPFAPRLVSGRAGQYLQA